MPRPNAALHPHSRRAGSLLLLAAAICLAPLTSTAAEQTSANSTATATPTVVAVTTGGSEQRLTEDTNLSLIPRYEVELQENIEYGTGGGEKLLLHLARPIGAPAGIPGCVFIHGGGWKMGSRDDFKNEIREFARHGCVCISISYRLAPEHRWPAQIEDCKCAVRWLRAHAQELGVDPQRIGALGGSAGGHLSQLLGVMGSADGLEGSGGWSEHPSQVQAVVNFCGPSDLVDEFSHQERGKALASLVTREGVSVLQEFLGGTPDEVPDAYRLASPINYVSAGDAPTLILQGTHDILVPYRQAVALAAALARRNVHGRLELVFGNGHGWEREELTRATQSALAFFAEHLAPRR